MDLEGIHLWLVNLRQIEVNSAILSSDERHKADRFYFAQDRQDYIAAHGYLRQILGPSLALSYGPYGKPFLKDAPHLHFNMSRTNGWALYAVSTIAPIGVDIEKIDADLDFDALLDTVLTPQERIIINDTPEAQKRQSFYDIWTRKEAYLKAIGTGLNFPLHQLNTPDLPLYTLEIPGYAAALSLRASCGSANA